VVKRGYPQPPASHSGIGSTIDNIYKFGSNHVSLNIIIFGSSCSNGNRK
jgi:hypothetical protein